MLHRCDLMVTLKKMQHSKANHKAKSATVKGLLVLIATTAVAASLLWKPINGYLSERALLNSTRAQVSALQGQNRQISNEIGRLSNPNEIAYLAKTKLDMVPIGAKSVTP